MELHQDLKEFVALLNANNVKYLIAGAHALACHGYPRYTGDLDIWIEPAPENVRPLLDALQEFGFGDLGLSENDFCEPKNVIQLGVAPNRIDLLTTLTGLNFTEAWDSKVDTVLDTIPCRILGRESLIKNKKALGRTKDLADIEFLESE